MILGSNADCFEKVVVCALFYLHNYGGLHLCYFWLLAHELRDLSQAETKIIVVTS